MLLGARTLLGAIDIGIVLARGAYLIKRSSLPATWTLLATGHRIALGAGWELPGRSARTSRNALVPSSKARSP